MTPSESGYTPGRLVADFPDLAESDVLCSLNPGLARKARGDRSGTIADCQRFLGLAPNAPQARAVRAEIQRIRQQQAKAGAGAGK